jgi:hypothetical protein
MRLVRPMRPLWRWFTLDNVSRLADLGAKLAAIIAAVAAVNFLTTEPGIETASAKCRSAVDLRVLAQAYGGSTQDIPPNVRSFAALFPPQRPIFASGLYGVKTVKPHRDETSIDCRPLFRTSESLPARWMRDSAKTYPLPQDVFPRDFAQAAFIVREPALEIYNEVPLVLGATYTQAEVTVVNRGGGTADKITVESNAFEMRSPPFRLRSNEARTVTMETRPGVRGYLNGGMRVSWDTVRGVDERLVKVLLVAFGLLLIAVFVRDVASRVSDTP